VIRRPSLLVRTQSFVRAVLGGGALLLVGVAPARAQQDPLLKLDQTSRFVIEALWDSARVIGVPDAPLRSVTYLGVRRGADGRKIVDAVRRKFGFLVAALGVLGPVGDAELDAASAVLAAGAKPAQLAAFKPRQKGRNDLDAFTVWADLISRGVPGEEASSAITKLWQDGADEMVFRRLWNDVQGDISQGLNPGAALQVRIQEAPGRTTSKPVPPEG
jgi:hypothetical protein